MTLPAVGKEELRLATKLLEASADAHFDLDDYVDQYESRLTKLVAAKAKGQKIIIPPREEKPQVINLMDALRQSLTKSKGHAKRPATTAPRRTTKRRRA